MAWKQGDRHRRWVGSEFTQHSALENSQASRCGRCPPYYFELLLWDDGSTDLSPQIARYYALRDPRIRVKAAQNQGFTSALKTAIAATSGQYLGWVDSDDLLAPTAPGMGK